MRPFWLFDFVRFCFPAKIWYGILRALLSGKTNRLGIIASPLFIINTAADIYKCTLTNTHLQPTDIIVTGLRPYSIPSHTPFLAAPEKLPSPYFVFPPYTLFEGITWVPTLFGNTYQLINMNRRSSCRCSSDSLFISLDRDSISRLPATLKAPPVQKTPEWSGQSHQPAEVPRHPKVGLSTG